MRFLETVVILICWFLTDLEIATAERPSFRILAPKFICGQMKASNSSDTGSASAPQQITIGLQTKGGQRLHYDVTVHFELLNGIVSQRHTLLLWKSVRQLEKRFKAERELISEGNQITIPNEDLVPGVIYTFNVVASDLEGARSQDQNFTVTYRGKHARAALVQEGSSSIGDVSLLLLGSEVTYPDVPFTVTAKVVFCRPRNDYKFKWTVQGLDEALAALNTSSDVLEIPAGNLSPGKNYIINVTVVESTTGKNIVAANMKLNVLNRGLRGKIFPIDATTGFAQTTEIRTVFNDRKISNVNWSCKDSSGDGSCSEDLLVSKNSATISFIKESKYTISVAVEGLQLDSHIKVNSKSTVSVVLQSLPPMYLFLGQRYEIPVDVSGLFPKCTSNWTVVKQEGFAYFDSTSMGGIGGVRINDIEENFLSELVDYGNDTVTREVTLIIPDAAQKWDGLVPDASYKFRLITQCPEPIDDSVDSKVPRGTVTSHWDMILETNAPPKGLPLEVIPNENGTALNTFYTFSTGMALERETDFPLRYSYWYSVEGNSINFASYYEVMSAETQLPYSKGGVTTFYEVCDSRSACSRIDGPKVSLLPNTNLNQEDLEHRIDSVKNSFLRGNIIEATKLAFDAVVTLKNQDSKDYSDFYTKIMSVIEVQTAIVEENFADRSRFMSASDILQFAKQVKVLVDFGHTGSYLLSLLLELIDAVEYGPTRETRQVNPAPATNTAGVKLDLYESQIMSKNDSESKQQLLGYIPIATEQFCTNKQGGYSGKLVTLDVMRWSASSKNPLQDGVRIPDNVTSPMAATVKTSEVPTVPVSATGVAYYCLAKIWFRSDVLTSEPMVGMYRALLLVVDKTGAWKQVEWKDGRYLWNVSLAAGNSSGSYKCEVMTTDLKWDAVLCESSSIDSFLKCNCSEMNYIRVITKKPNETTTATTLPTTAIVTPVDTTTSVTTTVNLAESTTDTDILTFAPLSTNSPPTSISIGVSTTPPTTTLPNLTSTAATIASAVTTQSPTTVTPSINTTAITTTTSNTPPTTSNPNTTLQQADQLQANITLGHLGGGGGGAGPLEYSIIGALVLCAALTVAALVLYRRRRHTTSLTEELQGIVARVRSHSLPVRYARFQDEHNMNGDNVSTISDTVTI
ncbi:uncharacterized protein LOC5580082 [Aedes aegypti]|uniref:Uncharacterized protein n=1 Tax=Aedes aegypti TaxID=7159 RepID=A0A6I8U0I1_AEDAE|nr:uncharacterized protein LOC5580082 [Aedes aegypti]